MPSINWKDYLTTIFWQNIKINTQYKQQYLKFMSIGSGPLEHIRYCRIAGGFVQYGINVSDLTRLE